MGLAQDMNSAVASLFERGLSQSVQPTEYDTSWAARLTKGDGSSAYPHLVDWLMERQHPDGSWGSQIDYAPDRLLTTLAIVVLLAQRDDPDYDQQLSGGEEYLKNNARSLESDFCFPVGFELILPTLLAEAEERGIDLPYASLRRYELEREEKLRLLPMDRLFTTRSTALFSLEAFGTDFDVDGAVGLLQEDGSMAGSPSATAYLLSRVPDWQERLPRSVGYLEDLLSRPDTGLPAFHPCDVFGRAWPIYYFQHGEILGEREEEQLKPYYEHLMASLKRDGVGFSSTSGFVDSDDTAITLLVLQRAGYEVDGSCLLGYERHHCFAVYDHEKNPSVSANLHVLEALDTLPEEHRHRVRDKIIRYLLSARRRQAFWTDKWHVSAYYPTTRALMIMSLYVPEEMERTLEWILGTQRADGSWGQFGPTTEETSLALLALLRYHRTGRPLAHGPLRRAAEYLLANDKPPDRGYPELWVCKVLYAPTFAIEAARLAALSLYNDTFGDIY